MSRRVLCGRISTSCTPMSLEPRPVNETDLRLTQRMLAHCQAAHQQQDSLLVALRAQYASSPPPAAQ
jgi:hypothetical protein